MSMTLRSRGELYKLREIVTFLLTGAGATPQDTTKAFCCYFCRQHLDASHFVEHGNSTGPKFTLKLTIHHVDGDHDNNEQMNKALAHTKCHKSFHRREANLARRVKEIA